MAVTTEEIREKYRNLDDQRVFDIAVSEVYDLRPVAVQVLHTEISRRGLSPILHEAVDLQALDHSDPRFEELLAWFRQLPCPHCGGDEVPLNAARLREARAPGAIGSGTDVLVAGCPPCLQSQISSEYGRQVAGAGVSALVGCITFPVGIVQAIFRSREISPMMDDLRANLPTEDLKEYVSRSAGLFHLRRSSES